MSAALRHAAVVYDRDANNVVHRPRVAEAFKKQAADARARRRD